MLLFVRRRGTSELQCSKPLRLPFKLEGFKSRATTLLRLSMSGSLLGPRHLAPNPPNQPQHRMVSRKKMRLVRVKHHLCLASGAPLVFTMVTFVRRCGTSKLHSSKPCALPLKSEGFKTRGFRQREMLAFERIAVSPTRGAYFYATQQHLNVLIKHTKTWSMLGRARRLAFSKALGRASRLATKASP